MRRKTRPRAVSAAAAEGRLQSRPGDVVANGQPGTHALDLEQAGEGILYVPPTYTPEQPMPLVVMLHGAGGTAQHSLAPLRALAEANGLMLLATSSLDSTWDVIVGDYGPDVAMIDMALGLVFQRYAIDQQHLAIGGFSDGASYALSLGLSNGALFKHILAFSPGFMSPAQQEGMPRIFISHGTHDEVLPIDACSRRIVPRLQRAGYDVRYREFDGPHTVPPTIAQEAVDWFFGR